MKTQGMMSKKWKEAVQAVLPIMGIVLALSLCVLPIPSGILLSFLLGGLMLIAGMMLFSLGAELSMETMGQRLGSKLTASKKLWLILLLGFVLGFIITIAEPDLTVLAGQVAAIPNRVLIFSVAAGVGLFLLLGFLRMLLGIPLRLMLMISYAVVFGLLIFSPKDFLTVAFDSGGVTTGPMTVPFIMALGVGVSAIRSDNKAADDSFGLVALSSVGPILAVLILSIVYRPDSALPSETWLPDVEHSQELGMLFAVSIPTYLKEIALSMLPIILIFGVFQLVSLRLSRRTLLRIGSGLLYTYAGLVLFMTGVHVGFLPTGTFLGMRLAALPVPWMIVPIGMLIGFFIVKAEPAIYVLMRQVEELTNGAVKGKLLQRTLCLSVAVSVGIAMIRVLTGISILWFVVPGYAISLLMSLLTPRIFTAIAFDSGGVASGPMTASFLLPFAMGACQALGGNVVTDAFGVVAMVAMTPLIAIQGLGLYYRFRGSRSVHQEAYTDSLSGYADDAIIEL